MNIRILAPSIAASFIALMFLPVAALASSAALYVSPASGTVKVGSVIPVQVRVNTGGDPVNAVQANITYNASQLAYDSVDATGSAFSLTANIQTDSGSVKMARAIGGGESPVTGDFLFATVYFKALTTTGTSSVAVSSNSHVVRSTDSVDIMAGAPAASGPKASTTGAPKPVAFTSIADAKAAVAAQATPTPQTAASNEPGSPVKSNEPDMASDLPLAINEGTKVLSWNNPIAWGGLVALLALVGGIIYMVLSRRKAAAVSISGSAAAPTTPSTISNVPHGSVDTKTGIINSETIYPSSSDSDNSNQGQR